MRQTQRIFNEEGKKIRSDTVYSKTPDLTEKNQFMTKIRIIEC